MLENKQYFLLRTIRSVVLNENTLQNKHVREAINYSKLSFRGKITYYTHPPEKPTGLVSAEIVTQMAQEFDIDSLISDETHALKGTSCSFLRRKDSKKY